MAETGAESGEEIIVPRKSVVDRLAEFTLKRKELFAWITISGADLVREIATRDPFFTSNLPTRESSSPEWLLSSMSHGGGVFDAYTASLLTYYGISLVTSPFKDKIPTNVKVAVSAMVGLGAVVAVETGIMGSGGTAELADIPSGVLGSMIFGGVMLLNRKFIEDSSKAIRSLKKEG